MLDERAALRSGQIVKTESGSVHAVQEDHAFQSGRDGRQFKLRIRNPVTARDPDFLSGSYQYEVESIEIVEPDNMKVLADSRNPTLTLITCYPFYYIGPAPKRFIVLAQQISLDSLAEVHVLQRGDKDSPDQGPTK